MIKFSIFFVASFFISHFASAKTNLNANADRAKIEKYFVNPAKDFSWMNESEKAAYVSFLYSLNLYLDLTLNKNSLLVVKSDQSETSQLNWQQEFFNRLMSMQEAQAAAPLVVYPLALRAGTALAPYIEPIVLNLPRRNIFMGMADLVPQTTSWWSKLTSAKGIAIVSTAASVPFIVSELKGDPKAPATTPIAAASAPPTKPAAVPTVDSGSKYIAQPRLDGSFCIFGGYASKYKSVESRSFCPAPAEMVNSSICEAKKINPSFLCQSFGLSRSKDKPSLSDDLCIPLRSENGLRDLTFRCMEAFSTFAEKAKAVDTAQLTAVQDQIKKGILALESERGLGDVGLLAYCADKNKLNRGLQKDECSALMGIMDQYKKDLPKLAALAGKKLDAKKKPSYIPADTGTTNN